MGFTILKNQVGKLELETIYPSYFSESSISNKDKIWLQHFRLGHPSFSILKVMFPLLFKGIDVENLHCDICELAKHKRAFFPVSNKRTSIHFALIHSDIWGPSTVPNVSGARWFISFIDGCTRMSWIFLLKHKSEVSFIFPIFHNMVKNQFGVGIKRFRSDDGKDYFNQNLSPYFQKEGIIHKSSCINTPQQNEVAQRKNGHFLAITRACLFQRNVPKNYWGEAVLTAAHLINRLPSRVLGFKSPVQVFSKYFPDFRTANYLVPKIFGCVSFVHIHSHNRGKLNPRALKCVFVGYSSTQKGYKCFHPPTKKFFVSADVTFVEKESYFAQPYLQGETSLMEDKDKDLFLLLELDAHHSPSSTNPLALTPIDS